MTDHTDLLRRLQEASGKAFGSWPWELCLQAKVAIEALEADNAALRSENARLLQLVLSPGTIPFNWKELEADNAALREQIANAIRLYPQFAEAWCDSAIRTRK